MLTSFSQFRVLTAFLFFKLHKLHKNAKIGVLENLEIKIFCFSEVCKSKNLPLKVSAS